MKNIQVIDGAANCTFSIFQATDDEFALIFRERGQEIEYAEDLRQLPNKAEIEDALARIWERPVRKREAMGIHGTLFYELQRYKRTYRDKCEAGVDPGAMTAAQRRLFGIAG